MDENSILENKNAIIEVYRKIVSEKSRLPTYSDFLDNSITERKLRHHFGNLTKLHSHIETEHNDILSDNLAHESQIFGEKRLVELQENLKKFKRFVITTAVTEKNVFEPFYQSLKSYCEKNDALLLIIACSDIASTSTTSKGWTFDPVLKNEHFIRDETKLNERFFISNIKMSAKHINPTTGMSRVGQRKASYVFASPKQFLEIVATSSNVDRSPMALMTTGAITMPDYNNERYMSQRTSYIAENDHVMGALIVEIENSKAFHFRQLQANNRGEFVDFGTRYKPDGTTASESCTLVLGDWHSGKTSKTIKESISSLVYSANVQDIVIHDLFNGSSVNHHIRNVPLKMAARAMSNDDSLENELYFVGADINYLHDVIMGNLIIVKSNHDEWLERYLEDGAYTKDPMNHYMSLDLAKAYLDGEMVLRYAVEKYGELNEPDRIVWLDRTDDHNIAGTELGQHGDIGTSGKPATMQSIEKDVGRAVVGHIHSSAILRGVYRVGTSTDLQQDYNRKGASSWTQTHALVYNDGSVQLINFINGKYRL